MFKTIVTYLQYCLPHHALTAFVGHFAASQNPTWKNFLIKWFIKRYQVNLNEALVEDIDQYPNFNSFFIRKLKPNLRPIDQRNDMLVSPADGMLTQFGQINKHMLLQAKQIYFDLETLLGNDKSLVNYFYNGEFATFYLAPHNYHRFHMPLSGKLRQTIYIPGRLFSVNRMTTELIPRLYSRNERFVCVFETEIGLVAIILVGAMIVGSIQTSWQQNSMHANRIITDAYSENIELAKGEELGFFKLGSTIVVLSPQNKLQWLSTLSPQSSVKYGQAIAHILNN